MMEPNDALIRQLNQGPLRAVQGADGNIIVHVKFPTDAEGYTERQCPRSSCQPLLFKVKDGPSEGDRCCPYCRQQGDGGAFATDEQKRYANEVLAQQAKQGMSEVVHRMMQETLGLDASGKRRIGSGMFSMEISLTRKDEPVLPVDPPKSQRPRRDVQCPECRLAHVVFGLATWCHGCGRDIFGAHIQAEIRDIIRLLDDAVARRGEAGERVYSRHLENVLEDCVTMWESALRYLLLRHLKEHGMPDLESQEYIQKKLRNQLQSIAKSESLVKRHLKVDIFADVASEVRKRVTHLFEARHPVTHGLGIVDRTFVAKAGSGCLGREIELVPSELSDLVLFCQGRILHVWRSAFP